MVKSLPDLKPQQWFSSLSASWLFGEAVNNNILYLSSQWRMFPKTMKNKLPADPFTTLSPLGLGVLSSFRQLLPWEHWSQVSRWHLSDPPACLRPGEVSAEREKGLGIHYPYPQDAVFSSGCIIQSCRCWMAPFPKRSPPSLPSSQQQLHLPLVVQLALFQVHSLHFLQLNHLVMSPDCCWDLVYFRKRKNNNF